MTSTNTYKIWGLAWPLILSHISQPLLGLVDTAVLGHLDSAHYLATVALGSTIIGFIYWCFGFLRMGVTSQIGFAFGNQDHAGLQKALLQAVAFALLLAALIILFNSWLFSLGIWALDIPSNLDNGANLYLSIRLYSSPAALLNYVVAGYFIGIQKPKLALLCVLASNGINIVLDIIFVVGFKLDIDGVAWATVISEYFALLVGGSLILHRHRFSINSTPLSSIFKISDMAGIFKQNTYLFLRTVALLLVMAYMTKQGAAMGIEILAANTIILQLAMLIAYGLDGFASAGETLVAEAKGKHSTTHFSNAMRGTLFWTVGVAILFCLFFYFSKPLLLNVMTSQSAIRDICSRYYFYIYLFCISGSWCFWLDGIFIGVGKFIDMMLSMLFCSSVIFLGLWWLLTPLQNHGLWLAYCGFLLARSISLGIMSYRYSKQNAWFKSA